jgi:hypothetical protein
VGAGVARSDMCYSAGMVAAPRHGARAKTACGVVAAPLFVSVFAAIGARRTGYDWRRHAVSSLGAGRDGWTQRANFMLVGGLYCLAARGLAQGPRRTVGPRIVPALVFGAGAGLIGSGLFVTDPVAGFPPSAGACDGADRATPDAGSTREGRLHNLCAIPIFVGIPTAALTCAGSAARSGEYRWAAYSAGSAVVMAGASGFFGAGFGGVPRLAGWGGVYQRISIASGFGWLSALSLRALTASRQLDPALAEAPSRAIDAASASRPSATGRWSCLRSSTGGRQTTDRRLDDRWRRR